MLVIELKKGMKGYFSLGLNIGYDDNDKTLIILFGLIFINFFVIIEVK